MMTFFQNGTNEELQLLLVQARSVCLRALDQYELAWESVHFIQLSDTITYKIDTALSKSYLLRIHSNQLSKEAIRSELTLLQLLGTSDDLHVPQGVVSRDGSYVLFMEAEEAGMYFYVTMMNWVDGEHMDGNEVNERCSYRMGSMVAKLHEETTCFVPPVDFARPTWGEESFKVDMAKLRRYYTRFLSDQAWKTYQKASRKILSQLADLDQNLQHYGIIHGDLHIGNIVFNDEQPNPIDFGRCGYGYYLYDIANTILGLFPAQRWEFIRGYESVRTLPTNYAEVLESFFIMCMIENYSHHSSDPRETSRIIDEQPYAQACIREYLMNAPFLFNGIEVQEVT
ncbi:MAG TPA: aminoglycoside phosphotransferase [Paenibacillus sp.]|uniref:phosphotransferase enzyme family protein n=1 Tax=Paenibacillus TaxID=44249 RepID=UPI000BA0F781|nr:MULTISPECIES: phosphotransferase [Paenibacillus]OZQ73380.1 aminoglycoside phosphotransferase [Paenibacillus taichungensis]HBU82194.1 aminoglycoside phosphotransferase [Paenibacillus sp.]